MELKTYVENASKEQLTALGTMGAWMHEKFPIYCTCSSKCNQNCQLVRELNDAFMLVGERLRSM